MGSSEVQGWPRPVDKATPRQAAPAKAAQPDDRFIDINTLTQYTTQELQLPLDDQRRAFETVVTIDGEAKILDLEPYSMRSPDFQVLVQDETGELKPYDVPAPKVYRGTIRGEAGSRVSASLQKGQLWANVETNGKVWSVQPLDELVPGVPALRSSHAVYLTDHVVPIDREVKCGVQVDNARGAGEAPIEGASEGGIAGTGFEVVEIGCDSDFEYYQLLGSNVQNVVNDIENLLNSVEFIFERDVDLAFEITVVVVRTAEPDPYSSTNAGTMLNEFASTWNSSPENGIRRDVGHFFTGKNVNGGTIGIAATPSTCFTTSAYSMVQSRYTASFTLRQSLSAHELGHTLDAHHCDGNGDCHIMCSGNGGCNGVVGSNLKFGFLAVSEITSYANSGAGNCLAPLPSPLAPPFFDDFESGNVLDTSKWIYIDGGSVSSIGVNEPSGTRSMNLDSTTSALYGDDETRTNFVQMAGQSNFVAAYYTEHIGVEAGKTLTVDYWASNLRWVNLAVHTSDGNNQTQFQYHQHTLPPNAHWNEFRLRFMVDGSSSNDDWYIDDVYVGPDPGLVFGACCLPDFSCTDTLTQDQCISVAGGTWQGDDTDCGGVDCSPALGACCMPDRSCVPNTTQSGCEVTAGGTWQGEGTPCTAGACEPPTGACCAPSGDCINAITESQCILLGGTYQGNDVACGGVNCPQPVGACCDPQGQCLGNVDEATCVNSGGVYQGDNVECASVNCPQPNTCLADFVDGGTFQPPGDGVVDGADLAFLLGEWLNASPPSLADIVDSNTFEPPPDGVVNGADLAYLLGEWGPCD